MEIKLTKETINQPFESYFYSVIPTIILLCFLKPHDINTGKISFAALFMLVIIMPALLFIYRQNIAQLRIELVTRFEKRFIAVSVISILIICILLLLLRHDTFAMISTWTYRITGIISLLLSVIALRQKVALPFMTYSLLSVISYNFLGNNVLFYWFIVLTVIVLIVIHRTSRLLKFNKDLRRSNILK